MKISKKIVSKFQEGGAAPVAQPPVDPAAQGGAPAPEGGAPQGGEDPIMQLAQLAQQAIQTGDCQAALSVCEGFMSLVQGSQGQGGGEAPQGGTPVYRKGGTLVRKIKA